MPVYVFQCSACGGMVDVSRPIAERDWPPEACDKCGKPAMARMFTAANVSTQWAGSHNNEYNKRGPRKS